MLQQHQFHIHDFDDIDESVRAMRVSIVHELGWRPHAEEAVARATEVLADYVLRHGGGLLHAQRIERRLELWTRDQGHDVLRTFASVREAGISPPTRAGMFEVPVVVHGGLEGLRRLVDEVRVSHFSRYRTEVRAVFLGEPMIIPHAPCPCVIQSADERHRGYDRH